MGLRFNHLSRTNSEPSQRLLEKFTYVPLGEMLTLGGTNAAVNGLNENVKFSGPSAAAARRLVYSYRMPTPTQGLTAAASALTRTILPIVSGRKK